LRPVPSVPSSSDDDNAGSEHEDMDRAVTGSRPRGAVPASRTPSPRARPHAVSAAEPGSLEALLADDTVTAILIAGPESVHVERGGKLESAGSLGEAGALTRKSVEPALVGDPTALWL